MTDQPEIEIYPIPLFPTLSVTDVAASLDWYTNRVGFASAYSLPMPGGGLAMAHVRWRKYADLLLVPDSSLPESEHPKGVGVAFSLLVDTTSVDDMTTNLANNGVQIAEGPVNRPWNTRDIVVHDPDGYTLVFFEPVDITRSFDDVMGNISDSVTGEGR